MSDPQTYAETLFEPGDLLEIRYWRDGAPASPKSEWLTAGELAASTRPGELTEQGFAVFVGANPRKAKGGKKTEDVALARSLFIDVDDAGTLAEVESRINGAGLPQPTLIVSSGRGFHAYWRLNEPLEDLGAWSRLQTAIATLTGADDLKDAPRVLRLPGTLHRKGEPKPVEIVRTGGARHTRDQFPESIESLEVIGRVDDQGRPGDEFNKRGDVRELLYRHGWTKVGGGANERWLRPGGRGSSATLKDGVFYVHSSNAAPFEPGRGYSAFGVLAMLEHGGDCSAAAGQLRRNGFGEDRPLVSATPAIPGAPTLPPQAPYPTDVFPTAIADYIREAARVLHVDESSVGTLLLPILAATIGNEREIAVRRDWKEPSIFWGAIVARSGSAKTPMLRLAMRGLLEVEQELDRGNADRREKYERERQEWKDTPKADRGAEPVRPREDRIVASDATIEKIAQMLGENPRGLLVEVDELAGLIAGFDSYKKAGGGDREKWLTLYNAGTLRVDRKTSASVKIDRASVSIVGGIQPSRLREVFSDSMVGSGLAARFLFAMPESRPKVNTGEEIPLEVEESFVDAFAKLWRLRVPELESRPGPFTISLDRRARERFLAWSNTHNQEGAELPEGGILEAWSKLEAIPLRISLILHTLEWPAGFECSIETLERAIALTEWHKAESRRVYDWMAGAKAETDDPIVAFIRKKYDGDASVRNLYSAGPLRKRPMAEIRSELKRLEEAGKGETYYSDRTERFRLK
ncbi:MAG: DUF3987 domain-containing protein [Phycisphaerales bacterium JB050]